MFSLSSVNEFARREKEKKIDETVIARQEDIKIRGRERERERERER